MKELNLPQSSSSSEDEEENEVEAWEEIRVSPTVWKPQEEESILKGTVIEIRERTFGSRTYTSLIIATEDGEEFETPAHTNLSRLIKRGVDEGKIVEGCKVQIILDRIIRRGGSSVYLYRLLYKRGRGNSE